MPVDPDIEEYELNEFEFEECSVFEQDGEWWIEQEDSDEIIIIENEEISFEEDEQLLSLGITKDVFEKMKTLLEK